MYVIKEDLDILKSDEVYRLHKAYQEKFGIGFMNFNYWNFQWKDGKCAGQVYKEALEEALRQDKSWKELGIKEKLPPEEFLPPEDF